METHVIPGARFVDPKVLSRIRDLELMARTVVDGFINGLHRAPYFGASIDFAEHRGYVRPFGDGGLDNVIHATSLSKGPVYTKNVSAKDELRVQC